MKNDREDLIAVLRMDYTASPMALSLMRQAATMIEADGKAQEPSHYIDGMGTLYTAHRAKFLGLDQTDMFPLYAAPVQRPLLTDQELRDTIIDALASELGDAYDCTRVWSAWSVGTMDQDDFVLVSERLDEIVDSLACAIERKVRGEA